MPSKPFSNRPNPPELVLLKALWAKGPLPERALHDRCAAQLSWTFSSTRKTLQRMSEKGFVTRVKDTGPARYVAKVSKTATLANMARDLMGRVFEVDGPAPINTFAGSKILTDEELDELEGLL